jgi:hypothetical protein
MKTIQLIASELLNADLNFENHMRIFKIKNDSNFVQVLCPVDNPSTPLSFLTFDCEPRETSWQEFEVYVQNPKTKAENFYSMPSGILVCDGYALELCRTVFEMSGEILPIKVERGKELYIINILECMNGLNYETTEWDYYKDGTKGRILKFGFHPERVLNESSLFKIPETSKTDIFCWADIKHPDDEFYHIYHNNNLTGLIFEELYNSESNGSIK